MMLKDILSRNNQWVILLIMTMSLVWWSDGLGLLENSAEDLLYQQMKENQAGSDIVIVGIDETTLETMGRWPYPRKTQAEVLRTIASGGPTVIGVDILYTEPSTGEDDQAFRDFLKEYPDIVLPVFARFHDRTKDGKLVVESLGEPIEVFSEVAHLAHINVFPDKRDGVVRKGLDDYQIADKTVPSFSRMIYGIHAKKVGLPDLGPLPTDRFGRFPIDFAGEPGSFEVVPFSAVADGSVPPDYFTDRIVLVGPYATAMVDDYYYTPMDKQQAMFGVEIHANILQMYLDQRMKQEVTYLIQWSIVVGLMLIVAIMSKRLTAMKSAIMTCGLILIWIIVGRTLYTRGTIVQLAYPVISMLMVFAGDAVLKYLKEFRERRRITGLFGRYVSPQVVKEIIKEQQGDILLGGRRKELSVLFVDIRGFTTLSESLEPERIVSILNEYLNLAATSIFDYGGTVDKFIGDAAMALFNAPLPLEQHPLMAARAAWAMKLGADDLEKELLDRYGKTVRFGIGIHFGEAVVGNIGASFRMDYTAIGDTVNTAARLESNAKPGQILISEGFYRQVKDHVEVNDMGELKVKGKSEPIRVYELTGVKMTDEE